MLPVLRFSRSVVSLCKPYYIFSITQYQYRDAIYFQASGPSIWNIVQSYFGEIFQRESDRLKMSDAKLTSIPTDVFQKMKYNSQLADNLITEMCDKIIEIETVRSNQSCKIQNVELARIQEENESLQREIDILKERLTLRQIRNGRKFIPLTPRIKLKSEINGVSSSLTILRSSKTNVLGEVADPPKAVKSEYPSPDDKTSGDPTSTPNTPKQNKGKPVEEGDIVGPVKKEKNAEKKKQAAPAVEVVDVSRLDFRVGMVIECQIHPDAETLYLEKVDVGEPHPRTVVSGLVKHVPLEGMQNRMVVLLCNLKPAKMRGVVSEAMVMCASTPEKVEILVPPPGAVPGDLVDFEGYPRNPDSVLNPKKKIFETVAPDLKTNAEKIATYKGIPFSVKGKGVVSTETLSNVNIK